MEILRLEHLIKKYNQNELSVTALNDINLSVKEGEFLSIMGTSGSGKSTMLNILGCLDSPTSGSYYLDGEDVAKFKDEKLAEIRNKKIGFVFQSFNLLPKLSSLENVELPMVYAGVPKKVRHEKAIIALEKVGLGKRVKHKPNELSGGQQQRVSIGRALINNPAIVLADEPTGNLDSKASEEILDLLKLSNKKYKQTIIMITHDLELAAAADRIITIEDGKIVKDERN